MSNMSVRRIAEILITILMGLLTALGLSPLNFNRRLKKFENSKIVNTYAITIGMLFCIFYTRNISENYSKEQFNLSNAVQDYYFYMHVVMLFIVYIRAVSNGKDSLKMLNNVKFFETLDYFNYSKKDVYSTSMQIAIKSILFPIIVEVALTLKQMHDEPEKNVLWTFYRFGPFLISSIAPNCYFAGVIMCKQFIKALNERLNLVVKEVNFLQTTEQMPLQKSYYRMQRFCDLADILDILAGKYVLICQQAMEYISLLALAFLSSLLSCLIGITVGCFVQYYAIAEVLIQGEAYDGFNAFVNFIYLIISILDITMQAVTCDGALEEARQTGLLLQRINLVHADIRFKQAVESFTLASIISKFRIEPLGLLEINISILHDLFATVASFLLILIQTDLSLRYSSK